MYVVNKEGGKLIQISDVRSAPIRYLSTYIQTDNCQLVQTALPSLPFKRMSEIPCQLTWFKYIVNLEHDCLSIKQDRLS